MQKSIAQLWNGNMCPAKCSGKGNPEIENLEQLIQRNLSSLEESLNENGKDILERYCSCVNEYIALTNEQAFCDGFCLGTKITAEAMNAAEEFL